MRNLTVLMILIGGFAFTSCAQTRTIKTKIYEDRRTGVALRSVVGRDALPFAKGYSQPVEFKLDDLKYLLGSIRWEEKGLFGWSQIKRVFTADEIYRLTPHLVEAFAKANPDQEIVFHLTTSKKGAIFWSDAFTNGRMFVKDKKLNILFANIDINPDSSEIYDGDPRNYYAGVLWRLERTDWQNLVEGEKGTHYNWVEVDFERGVAEKKDAEEAIRRKRERARTANQKLQSDKTGWSDWEEDEAINSEGKGQEGNLPPPPESP